MDAIDRRLIGLLRENARQPVSSLAASLGVSRATVQNRIARLVGDGTILGFTLRLPQEEDGFVRAVMMVEVRGDRSAPVLKALRGLAEVAAIHTTNGRWDLVVDLRADTLERFDAVLRRIRTIDGVQNSETSLLLSGGAA